MVKYPMLFGPNPLSLIDTFDSIFFNETPRKIPTVTRITPKANIYKSESGYSIEFAVPGFSRDDFEMSVDHDVLTVSMNVEDTQVEKEKIYRREWSYVSFSRSMMLPENAVIEQISAKYEAGILMVDVPIEGDKKRSRRVISVE